MNKATKSREQALRDALSWDLVERAAALQLRAANLTWEAAGMEHLARAGRASYAGILGVSLLQSGRKIRAGLARFKGEVDDDAGRGMV